MKSITSGKMNCKCMKASSNVSSSESDDDSASKPSVLLAHECRSKSDNGSRRRAEKVWAVSTESQKLEPESKAEPEETDEQVGDEKQDESKKLEQDESKAETEEKVGDIINFGKSSYFIIDIFEKEIMELGDKTDLNFKTFKKFDTVSGDAPLDHHFYNCYWSHRSCKVEREWGILERELAPMEEKGVSFFVRTYSERKELMRVAVTVANIHSLLFFDIKFPLEYPFLAPSFFYHQFGLPLSTPKPLRNKLRYNILDVFHHIEEIVLMNTDKSCQQMLDMLKRPLMGFEDFVKGHFRKKGALILQNFMKELDMEKESDKKMFWKMYIAFEDNKSYCEHLLNSDLKEELKKNRENECSLSDHYNTSSSYFPTTFSRFDSIKTFKSQSIWSKYLSLFSIRNHK